VEALFAQLRDRLEASPARTFDLPGVSLRESAVLVPLLVRDGEPRLVFTKRLATLRQHAGQVSFPGGARDPEDVTSLHTALREMREELGVPPARVEVLGRLDELPTVTEFRVHPFVGGIPADTRYTPNPDEVEEVFEAPLAHFLGREHLRTEKRTVRAEERDIYFYDYGRHVIWGATARIVRNLLDVAADLPALQSLRQT
jgi:8-oxo-dGTP pyrophosphatase MutT (NUDIX family)